jgi:hypothetical protein
VLLGYCVRRAGDPAPATPASSAAGNVFVVEEAELGIWLSEAPAVGRDQEAMRRHDAVNREALRSATPLPLRFGTHFTDEEGARQALRSRRDEFLRTLDRVGGSVEMGLRVFDPGVARVPPETPSIGSGREFLEHRRRAMLRESEWARHAALVLERIDQIFDPVRVDCRITTSVAPPVLGTLAHLIAREGLEAYRSCAEQALKSFPDLRIRLTGPWAPYSFV